MNTTIKPTPEELEKWLESQVCAYERCMRLGYDSAYRYHKHMADLLTKEIQKYAK